MAHYKTNTYSISHINLDKKKLQIKISDVLLYIESTKPHTQKYL